MLLIQLCAARFLPDRFTVTPLGEYGDSNTHSSRCTGQSHGGRLITPIDQLCEAIDSWISHRGFAIQYVEGEANRLPWAYTIGLTETLGHPEIVLFGLGADSAYDVLNGMFDELSLGRHFPIGRDRTDRLRQLPICLLPVPWHCWETTLFQGWIEHYRRKSVLDIPVPEMLQLVWAHPSGRFPWHPQAPERYERLQLILEDVRPDHLVQSAAA